MDPSSFLFKTTSVSAVPAATRDVAAIAIGNLRVVQPQPVAAVDCIHAAVR